MLHDCNADQDAAAQQPAQATDVLSARATARYPFNIQTRGRQTFSTWPVRSS